MNNQRIRDIKHLQNFWMNVALNKKDIVFFYTKAKLEEDVVETYIGFLWWILDPVLTAFVYYVIFGVILHSGKANYLPFLFVGIISWKWFQSSVKDGSNSIISKKSLYKKIYLPKIIFPWIEVNFTTIKFLVALSLIVLIYPLFGFHVTANHLYLPLVILCQYVFSLGLGTLLSSLTPFFPDFSMMVGHILRLAMYPSGVIFTVDRVPEKWKFLMEYNPMARAIEGYRNIIMDGKAPSYQGLLLLVSAGLLLYGIGYLLIQKFEGKYAKLT